jgi:hypothetical protein
LGVGKFRELFVISLTFGHNKDRHDFLLFKFPNPRLYAFPF